MELGKALYMGKKLEDMTREELYKALWQHDELYRSSLKDHERELDLLHPTNTQ